MESASWYIGPPSGSVPGLPGSCLDLFQRKKHIIVALEIGADLVVLKVKGW